MTSEEVLPVVLYFFNFFAMLCVLCFFCSPHRNMPEEIFLFISFACKAAKNLRPSGSKLCCLLSVVDYLFPLRRSSFFFCVILCSCWMQQKKKKNLVELRLAIISTKSNAIFPPLRSFASSLVSLVHFHIISFWDGAPCASTHQRFTCSSPFWGSLGV